MGWLVDKAYASIPSRENVQEDIELDDETIRTVLNRLERDPYAFFDEILEILVNICSYLGYQRISGRILLRVLKKQGRHLTT